MIKVEQAANRIVSRAFASPGPYSLSASTISVGITITGAARPHLHRHRRNVRRVRPRERNRNKDHHRLTRKEDPHGSNHRWQGRHGPDPLGIADHDTIQFSEGGQTITDSGAGKRCPA